MLRKTSHQRASMKRNPIYESVIPSSPSPLSSQFCQEDLCDMNMAYKNNDRKDSLEWNPNEMIFMSEKYIKENEERAFDGDSITTEIAPGIVIKGHVAEL